MFDVIGDVHGHADELEALLLALGYQRRRHAYEHPERRVVFLGDFIDRGPKIRQTLAIVRPMVEEGKALAVMGNHELNALAYHTPDPERPEGHLRPHLSKNVLQHKATVEQIPPNELSEHLAWFRTLPAWLELDGLRVVHACWDGQALATIATALQKHRGVTTSFLQEAHAKGSPLFLAVETVLKGKEAKLPPGVSFQDKEGHVRTSMRTRWYLSPAGHTYGSYAFQADPIHCDRPLEPEVVMAATPYPESDKPVFIGHYWLSAKRPARLAANVACLDYSVARGGYLCAYRWEGEQALNDDHFVWIGR